MLALSKNNYIPLGLVSIFLQHGQLRCQKVVDSLRSFGHAEGIFGIVIKGILVHEVAKSFDLGRESVIH